MMADTECSTQKTQKAQKVILVGSIFSSVILLGACSNTTQEKQTTPSATTSSAHVVKLSTAPLTSKLHQTHVLDDQVQYAIDAVEKSKCLGKMSKGKTAGEGALFYIVRFHALNNGKEALTVVTDNFKVTTADGQDYTPSSNGKEAVIINGGTKDLFESSLKPGESRAFLAIFELPVLSVKNGADLIVPSTKSGSNDRWVVRLASSH